MTERIGAIVLLLILCFGCQKPGFDPVETEEKFATCIGQNNQLILDTLSANFQAFLIDNDFCSGEKDLLEGYKNYLGALMNSQGLNSAWTFQNPRLEKMILLMELHHFAEFLNSDDLSNCVFQVNYPEHFTMADYRKIMPQHMVSPERFASTFIADIDKEQFQDPVLRKLIALEYFLGPVIYILRPDTRYLTAAH